MTCRYPFQHEHDTCSCNPDPAAITRDRFEANAGYRQSMAGNLAWFAQGTAVALISFAVLFGAGVWGLSRAEAQFQSDLRR
jgi:hypothetical protein